MRAPNCGQLLFTPRSREGGERVSTCMICLGDFEDDSMIEDITGTKYCLLDSGGICPVCGMYELKCKCEGENE
jgi:hypothetical protein